jgi:hypothetical protein
VAHFNPNLFYYQINRAFFCKKAFKHQVTKKEPKTQKKDYFFLRELSVYLVFAERRIPANWRVILVLSSLFAAMMRYNITDQIFVFLAKNIQTQRL